LISRKVDYALRALVCLAQAGEGKLISVNAISKRIRVPVTFLSKIFQILGKAGIVKSVRGRDGGVMLIKINVSLAKIIQVMDPAFHLNKCIEGEFNCFMKKKCPVRKVLVGIEADIMKKLKSVTLLDMAAEGGR
jgi:Rrf2 family protein